MRRAEKMNTELTFAVLATVLLLVAIVLMFKFAPRRREVFMFDVFDAAFGSASPATRSSRGAKVNARIDRGRGRERDRLPRARNRSTLREVG
jgi:hypothetical protein